MITIERATKAIIIPDIITQAIHRIIIDGKTTNTITNTVRTPRIIDIIDTITQETTHGIITHPIHQDIIGIITQQHDICLIITREQTITNIINDIDRYIVVRQARPKRVRLIGQNIHERHKRENPILEKTIIYNPPFNGFKIKKYIIKQHSRTKINMRSIDHIRKANINTVENAIISKAIIIQSNPAHIKIHGDARINIHAI